jgi:NAD(P)-dependent dehydrogenase (short-subunit alcohol dehydrogenase family)
MTTSESVRKVVLITGASRGFGRAAALKCAERGHTVIGTMRRPERDAAALYDANPEIEIYRLDVTDDGMVQRMVAEVAERHGRIDVLVNNAGYGLYGPVEDASDEEIQRQFDTNLIGQIRLARAVLPLMRRSGGGKIVNTSSLAGRVVGPLMGLYAASKYAVEAMSEALRLEVARWNVQVTILEPGMYKSDWQTTNLDVCAKVRDGESPYQAAVERGLTAFRALAATRPGSDAVAAAIADIVDLAQPLPMRWIVGEDAQRAIAMRVSMTDDQWESWVRSSGGYRAAFFEDAPKPS